MGSTPAASTIKQEGHPAGGLLVFPAIQLVDGKASQVPLKRKSLRDLIDSCHFCLIC